MTLAFPTDIELYIQKWKLEACMESSCTGDSGIKFLLLWEKWKKIDTRACVLLSMFMVEINSQSSILSQGTQMQEQISDHHRACTTTKVGMCDECLPSLTYISTKNVTNKIFKNVAEYRYRYNIIWFLDMVRKQL